MYQNQTRKGGKPINTNDKSTNQITAPSDAAILYEDNKAILYVCDGRPILKIGKASAELDNYPYAVDTVLSLLTNGYKIRSGDMWVLSPEGQSCGSLKHHILAAYAGIPLTQVIGEPVYMIEKSKNDCNNLCVSNMLCNAVPTRKLYSVVRQRDQIIVSYTGRSRSNKIIWYTDYSNEIYNLLNRSWLSIRPKARDKRLCANIAGGEYYLYHIIMAVHLYKPKIEKDCILDTINQFKQDYLDKGLTIDHLDGNVANNLMSNLMIMSRLNNQEKEGLYRKFRNLSTKRHFIFCRLRRYDDTSVTIQAGCCTNFGEPVYMLDSNEVIPSDSIVDRLRAFLDCIMERDKWSETEDQ